MSNALQNYGADVSIRTGYPSVDLFLSDVPAGLIVLDGRKGIGKTSLALNFALAVASGRRNRDVRSVLYMAHRSAEALRDRLLSISHGWEASSPQELEALPIQFAALPVTSMLQGAVQQCTEGGWPPVSLIVLDDLVLCEACPVALAKQAHQLGVVILVTAQSTTPQKLGHADYCRYLKQCDLRLHLKMDLTRGCSCMIAQEIVMSAAGVRLGSAPMFTEANGRYTQDVVFPQGGSNDDADRRHFDDEVYAFFD